MIGEIDLPASSDVVLALGTRLGPFGTLPQYGIEYWPKNARIIQVDSDHRMLGLVKPITVGVCGDAQNEQLQRVYGTAWADKKQLDQYLHRLEEAEKRDHRKIGKTLNLFHQQEEAPGMVFWHPKGWTIWQQVEQYMRRVYRDNGSGTGETTRAPGADDDASGIASMSDMLIACHPRIELPSIWISRALEVSVSWISSTSRI